jgi:hypothetical protein
MWLLGISALFRQPKRLQRECEKSTPVFIQSRIRPEDHCPNRPITTVGLGVLRRTSVIGAACAAALFSIGSQSVLLLRVAWRIRELRAVSLM